MRPAVFISLLLASAALLQAAGAATQVRDVQPRYGSIAGGTLLTVSGSDFISDFYSGSASVSIGGIPCTMNWYTVSSSMIQCTTQPYPFAEEGRSSGWMRVMVTINGTQYDSNRNYIYHWSYTPRVRRVVPPAVPVGSVIAVGGDRFLEDPNAYTRIFVGDQICDIRDPLTNAQYGFYAADGLYWVKCRVTQVIPGAYNVTINLPSTRGTSWNHSQPLGHGPDNNLVMLEVFPDVHSVSQHEGSTEGGTELAISGIGFDVDVSQMEVDVDGIPCQLLGTNATMITCRTRKPPEDHLSIAGENYSYPHVQEGYRFKGSRGVSIEQYLSIGGSRVIHLKNSAKFPDQPDNFLTFPVFQPKNSNNGQVNYGARYTAFFTPLFSGEQRLYLASDDNGELSISNSSNISEVTTVATVSGHNTWHLDRIRWNDWRKYDENQRSGTLDLYTNSSYLLVGLMKQGSNSEFLRVGVHYPRAVYQYNESMQAMREEQYYRIQTALQYEKQMLTYVTNLTHLNYSTLPALTISWGGRETEPIAFHEINVSEIVRSKVLDMFNATCDFSMDSGISHYTNKVYDFELGIGSSDTWPRWQGGDYPVVVEYETFCGRYSLEIKNGGAKAFDYSVGSDDGFDVRDFPELCMAYKIPPSIQVDIAVEIRVEESSYSQWYYITMTAGDVQRQPRLTSALDVNADDQWHYMCLTLQDIIMMGINPNISDYTILGFALVSYQNELPFYIDEVSFSQYHRTTPQRTPPARPGGHSVYDVSVEVDESFSDDESVRTVIVVMEILPSGCTFVVPLMETSLDIDGNHTNVSVSQLQMASESVDGSYTLSLKGYQTRPLAHDASPAEIRAALEEDVPGIGTMTVWINRLYIDTVKRYCPGRTVTVRFETLPGDLPFLDVNTTNLTGFGVTLSQRETWQGGLFVAPIPGYLLQTVERTPQVHVRVRGHLAACSGGQPLYSSSPIKKDPCRFIYSPDHTPRVVSMVPDTIRKGTVVTLTGEGFGDEPEVQFDDVECIVSSSSATQITCTAGHGAVGPKGVLITTNNGYAKASITVNYAVSVSGVSPSSSSLGGGIVVSISGSGLIASDACEGLDDQCNDTTVVTVGGETCAIRSINASEIRCAVPPTDTMRMVDVMVTVTCCGGSGSVNVSDTVAGGLSYTNSLTATLQSVSPMNGSAGGGEVVTISGVNLPSNGEEVHIEFGGAPCTIQSLTTTTVTCLTSPHKPGEVEITLFVANRGNAMVPNGGLLFSYVLEVQAISHCVGSVFGGQTVEITGSGFGTDASAVDVSFGHSVCSVSGATDTMITCTTESAAAVHYVNNSGSSPDYGLGYRWLPDMLVIHVGDTVEWFWTGSAFSQWRNVAQVSSATATEYRGHGFRSERAVTGRFSFTFHTPGTFHYIAEGLADIGMRGTVIVNPIEDITDSVKVSVRGISADFTASFNCTESCVGGDAPIDGLGYVFGTCRTPLILSVEPPTASPGDEVVIQVQGVSIDASENLIVVGGMTCNTSNASLQGNIDVASELTTVATPPTTLTDMAITCVLPSSIPPGLYWVGLYVKGLGFGYALGNSSQLQVAPTVDAQSIQPSFGSLRGGTRVTLMGRAFHKDPLKNRVTIGSTSCIPINVVQDNELTCVTQAAGSDGYSSIVSDSEAVGYWSMQAVYWSSSGEYLYSDYPGIRNHGTNGHKSNGMVEGSSVISSQLGISGNAQTDQSVLINSGHIRVLYSAALNNPLDFTLEFWLRTNDGTVSLASDYSTVQAYRIIISSFHQLEGSNMGYLVVLNPCNQWEIWSGTGATNPETVPEGVCGLVNASACTEPCSDLLYVPEGSGLPSGLWAVTQGPAFDAASTNWSHIAAVWAANGERLPSQRLGLPSNEIEEDLLNRETCYNTSTGLQTCAGTWSLYVNGVLEESVMANYSSANEGDLLIGGSELTTPSDNGALAQFSGFLDEVAVYGRELSVVEISNHYNLITSKEQPVWVDVEGVVMSRTDTFSPVSLTQLEMVDVDWDTPPANTKMMLSAPSIIRFSWTRLHGVYQVTQSAFESCDLEGGLVRKWSSGATVGAVSIVLETSQTVYFIDSVPGHCQNGTKLSVQYGNEHVVEWVLGRMYDDVMISSETSLLFKWSSSSFGHNVVELRSVPSMGVCDFTSSDSGQFEREWQSEVTLAGDVYVTGLSEGEHIFVCTVPGHCSEGMHIKVVVTGDSSETVPEQAGGMNYLEPTTHTVFWRLQEYPTLDIYDRDSVQFIWHDFHSLLQVTEESFDSCGHNSPPLHEWGLPGVDAAVTVPHIAPGVYYYICGVAGHCDAGMKIRVVVHTRPTLPPLSTPIRATCIGCIFNYNSDATPQLSSVDPIHAAGFTTLQLQGEGFLADDDSVTGVTVWVGKVPCSIMANATSPETIECTLADYESGFYHVDVHVASKGLASVRDNDALAPGPHRNATEAARTDSPYPVFFLAASVNRVSPSIGSLMGGTEVTISGSGFSPIRSRVSVTLGDCFCDVIEASTNSITCITSACDTLGIGEENSVSALINVKVNNFPASTAEEFTFAASATPTIVSVAHYNPKVGAGDNLTIAGQNLSGSGVIVKLLQPGELFNASVSVCITVAASATEVNCTVPELSAGLYKVVVQVSDKGYSMEASDGAADVDYGLSVDSFSPLAGGNGGGLSLNISGSGFSISPSDSFSISVCNKQCNIVTTMYSSVSCTLPASTVTDPTTETVSCSVNVTSNQVSVSAVDQFNFSAQLTPTINHITPSSGGTAGGTILEITGSGFWPEGVTSADQLTSTSLTVTIDGALCDWRQQIPLPSTTSIRCRTSRHRTTLDAEVEVFVAGKGKAVSLKGTIMFKYVDRWSSNFTWGGLPPPLEGESVYIQAGQTVLLDTDTPVLNLVLIEGELIFEDEQDVSLQARYIFINNGKFQVGTEEAPFMHMATITLHGTVNDPEIPIYGAKVLAVRQGQLDLHGLPRNVTWTRLAITADKNETTLLLQDAVDWVKGDRIVIAPTGKDGNETEVHTVESVEDSGFTVMLEEPLAYTHFGITESFEDGQFIDIRAEVGLLSHNIIVQGSVLNSEPGFSGRGADMYGAQILVHRAGPNPTPIRIEHTEVRHMGQAFRLGRYAIHFHLSGTMNGSYVRNCAIHHSFNRALTAHGIHDLLVEGNVAYDIMGHTFFVEDGIETNNWYIHNLGVLTRGSSSLLNTDQIPATFWITNPRNIFIDNAAVASCAYGFWYDLDDHPSGPSFTTNVCPNKEPFGTFENNVAHTCSEFGLRIWETYVPYEDGCDATVRATAKLYNFTSYNNGIHGVEFSIVGHVQIIGFKVSDNRDNGIEIQETMGDWGGPLIMDTLVVSHTSANSGGAGTGGIKTPNTRGLTISNVTFVNFNLPGTSCLRACSQCKVFQGGFQVWFNNITFLGNSSNNKAAFKWEHEVLYWDQDGSLSGVQGGWVLPNSGLHPPQYCSQSVPELSAGDYSGALCSPDVYFLRMAWNQAQPLATLTVDVNITNEFGFSIVPWRHYRLTHLDGYMFVFPAGYQNSIVWRLPPDDMVDTTSYNAGVYGVRPQDWALITHEFVKRPNHVEVGGTYEGLDDIPTAEDPNFSWFLDNTTDPDQVTYIISGVNQTFPITNYTFSYSYEACPRSGCPQPGVDTGPLETDYRLWSDNMSWPGGRLPVEGDDVIIEGTWRMLLDICPPPLGTVYIFGELKFQDKQDLNFSANLILVRGPNGALTVGEEEDPFKHRAIITLTGRRGEPDLALARTMNLGSKALGVFSNVSLVGRPVDMPWTHLGATAERGTHSITLKGPNFPDWAVGDEIVIASSSYDPYEAEVRTITSISGGSITVHEPLQHTHTVSWMIPPEDITGSLIEDGVRMFPEVGLLTRNIVVQGGDSAQEPLEYHHYGCRVLIGQYSYENFEFTGQAHFDSVEFRYCGQGGYFAPHDPRYSIAFKDMSDGSSRSYIRRCSIHHGYNTAIGVHRSNGVVLEDNVIYRTTGSSVKIGGSGNVASRNLALLTSTIQPNEPKDNHAVDFPATYDVDATNELKDNVAAGSTRIGFRFTGEACGRDQTVAEASAQFWGNKAHSGLIGLVIMGLPTECTAVGGFTAYTNWDYGIFSSIASRLTVTDCKIAVGKIGLNLNIFGPDPVAHRLGRKWVKIKNTLIVGLVEGEKCISSTPAHSPSVSLPARENKLGIMMSSFNKKRSKMDGTGKWHLMKGYPVIDGRVEATKVTFARFFSLANCFYESFAVGNNPLSPDAVHPMEMRETGKINVSDTNIAFFYEPDPAWIVQEDCIDMDCDGPKHALVRDVDGLFLGSSPREGSIAPYAELRFDLSRVPSTWLASSGRDSYLSAEDVVEGRGVARGTDGNTSSIHGGCVWVQSWQAYSCAGLQHHMLVIESMDADTEVRRLSPLALNGGDTGGGHYTDLLNGPMDHGWCTYYTCLKRLSTFFSIVVVGSEYHIWMTGTNPKGLRFHLLNADTDDAVILHLWYQDTLRKDVYKNGIFIESSSTRYTTEGAVFEESDASFLPTFDKHSGFNYFDRDTRILHLLLRGEDPVEIRTPPVVQVALDLAVPFDTVFDPRGILMNLAFVLGIDIRTIRLVNVIAEDSNMRRKRQAVEGGTNDTMVVIEIGNLPENISTPDVVAVSDQVAKYSNDSVDLGAGAQANLTNGTGIPGSGVEPTTASNTTGDFDEDPPSDFEADYEAARSEYKSEVQDYMNAVNEAAEVNQIAEDLALLIQTGMFEIGNTTVEGVTITVAEAQPPPVLPVIPPEFNETVSNPVVPVEEYQPVLSGESDGSVLTITVPVELVVVHQPPATSGHLVYIIVEARDSVGNVVKHLGISKPWMCRAVVQGGSRNDDGGLPTVGGVTSVPFFDGRAQFTRLRINEPSAGVTLQLISNPRNLVTTSSAFTIMSPPAETARKRVHFELTGDVATIENSKSSFAEVVKDSLAALLDIDISRVQNVEVITSTGIVIEVDILERVDTDPPDTPTLDSTLTTMQDHINTGKFSVIFLSQVYTSVNGSFQEGPAERPLPITTIILIVVVSTLGVVLLIIFISAVIFFCRRGMGKRPASSKNKVSNSSEPIELQPQSGNLLDATEDAGIVYYRNTGCEIEWTSEAEDEEFGASSNTTFSGMFAQQSDSSLTAQPSFLEEGSHKRNVRATREARMIHVIPYKPE